MQVQGRNRFIQKLFGVAAVLAVTAGLGACSILPEWMGGDPAAPSPDLASLPDKPVAASVNQPLADSLTSDMKNAKYSADALRGGDEAAAPPPPPPAVKSAAAAAAVASVPASQPVAQQAQAAPQAAEPVKDKSVYAAPTGTSVVPGALPDPTTQTSSAKSAKKSARVAALPAGAMPAEKTVAVAAPLPKVEPTVVPAKAPSKTVAAKKTVTTVAAVSPSDAALGFQPSAAPPLDPSVAQFVPSRIVNQYKAAAGQALSASSAHTAKASTKVAPKDVAYVDKPVHQPMPGSNVTAVAGSAAAVLYFPGDIVTLNGKALAQVRAIIAQYKAAGGQGVIRVVGHSSSRTPNMPVEKHLALVFQKSQDRATAVAEALIRAGVPADKILVEAVGDSQPIYYESMPKGEDGNRRVEIFLQG